MPANGIATFYLYNQIFGMSGNDYFMCNCIRGPLLYLLLSVHDFIHLELNILMSISILAFKFGSKGPLSTSHIILVDKDVLPIQ